MKAQRIRLKLRIKWGLQAVAVILLPVILLSLFAWQSLQLTNQKFDADVALSTQLVTQQKTIVNQIAIQIAHFSELEFSLYQIALDMQSLLLSPQRTTQSMNLSVQSLGEATSSILVQGTDFVALLKQKKLMMSQTAAQGLQVAGYKMVA